MDVIIGVGGLVLGVIIGYLIANTLIKKLNQSKIQQESRPHAKRS